MTDPFDHPDWKAYAQHAQDELVPMITESWLTISLVPDGPPDIKFAVELGLSIMLDKPIIAVVRPGTAVPARMVRVADEIVEGDLNDPGMQQRIEAAINRVTAKMEGTDGW